RPGIVAYLRAFAAVHLARPVAEPGAADEGLFPAGDGRLLVGDDRRRVVRGVFRPADSRRVLLPVEGPRVVPPFRPPAAARAGRDRPEPVAVDCDWAVDLGVAAALPRDALYPPVLHAVLVLPHAGHLSDVADSAGAPVDRLRESDGAHRRDVQVGALGHRRVSGAATPLRDRHDAAGAGRRPVVLQLG